MKIIGIQFIADKASIIILHGTAIEFASCSIENNLPINASEEHGALGNSVGARDRVRVELCLTRPRARHVHWKSIDHAALWARRAAKETLAAGARWRARQEGPAST